MRKILFLILISSQVFAQIRTIEQNQVNKLPDSLANKVNKVAGKGLSTNDFDNTYKSNSDLNTSARHTHSNKTILDNITAAYTTAEQTKLGALPTNSTLQTSLDAKFSREDVATYAAAIASVRTDRRYVVVASDENNGGLPTLYWYDGTGLQWIPTLRMY